MLPFAADTSPEAYRRYLANIQAMTPAQRVDAAFDLSACALEQALAVIHRQQPSLTTMEVRLVLLERLYGSELAQRARLSMHTSNHE